MNKGTIISGLVGLILGIFIAPWVLLVMPWVDMMGYRSNMMGNNQLMRTIDSHFIEQMIPHHEDAILMADLALEKAKNQEIKQLAQDIKRTQSEEINQMRDWHKSWFGKDVPDVLSGTNYGMGSGKMHMGMMGDVADIDSLKNAADFDKEFINQMIPHHQMAVMMAQMLQSSTNRPEMKELAKNIIDAQTREINQMREWYKSWYRK